MARKKHPDIGKFHAMYEHPASQPDEAPELFATAEAAIEDRIEVGLDEGDVVYVYKLVDVRVIRKETVVSSAPFVPEGDAW